MFLNKQMKFYIDFQCQNITKRYSENRENAYLAMKSPSASGALRWAPDPQLTRLRFAMSAIYAKRNLGPPLNQILDPLLLNENFLEHRAVQVHRREHIFMQLISHLIYNIRRCGLRYNSLIGQTAILF